MPYMSLTRLAAYLKKRRAAAKLTLREVAERAGLDYGFLGRAEAGAYQNVGIDTLRKIAQGYGVPLTALLVEAGYIEGDVAEVVPDLRTYLRTQVGLTDEGVKEAERFLDYAKAKYAKRARS